MNTGEMEKKKIGSRIKFIRNELGLTMKEFGQKFSPPASDSIVSRWERGISLPNNERLKIISELGNISIFYLTTGKKTYSDMPIEERKETIKFDEGTYEKILEKNRTIVKNYLTDIEVDKLDIAEMSFLISILSFLKYAEDSHVTTLSSIMAMINSSSWVKTDDSDTPEELLSYIKEEVNHFEEFLKELFGYEEEGD